MKRSLAVGILERVGRSNETVAVPRRRRCGAAAARLLSRRLAAVINGELPEEPLQRAGTPPRGQSDATVQQRPWVLEGFLKTEGENRGRRRPF